jgi:C4-dicarboxylate transporter, DctM subunit
MALGLFIMVTPLACGSKITRSLKNTTTDPKSPAIGDIVPDYGRAAGGTYILITGKNFVEDETEVLFGTEESNGVDWISSTQIKVWVPADSKFRGESVDVVVEVGEGAEALRVIKRNGFRYEGLSKTLLVVAGILIFLLALLGLPLFLVIGAASVLGYLTNSQDEGLGFFQSVNDAYGYLEVGLGSTIFNWVTDMGGKPLFIAIPLFTFAGSLMSESGAPTRLVNVARSMVGWFPGGLAWVTLLVCCFFTAFTGASGVTIIALGGLLFPILVKEGYGENYSLGLLTTGGSLGLLIPPSLPVIVYGIIAGLDADHIWDAGVGPMILIVLLLGGHAIYVAMRANVPRQTSSKAEIWAAIKAAAFEIPLPFVVVFGIKGGFVTATEASAVTAFWVLITEVFIYKDISLKELPGVIRRSMVLVGGLIIIIGLALAFTTYLTAEDVPQRILGVMQQNIDNQLTFLIMLNVFLLIVGCLMDIFSAILVVVPLIAPVALGFGVDPYHLAIIFLVNLEIGYSTPPVGINLFISSMRFRRPVFQLYRASLVFIAILLVGLLVITYWPALTIGRFDLPEVTIVDSDGEAFKDTVIKIKEGDEKTLVCQAKIGGITLEEAKEAEKKAREELGTLEKKYKLDYDELRSEINVKKVLIATALSADEIAKATQKMAELKAKRAPLDAAALNFDNKNKFRVALESLHSTARWKCRMHEDLDETGKKLNLSELEPGKHRIALTGTTDRKHLDQKLIDIEVAIDPDKKEDEDEDE